jgi:hypothetical protein
MEHSDRYRHKKQRGREHRGGEQRRENQPHGNGDVQRSVQKRRVGPSEIQSSSRCQVDHADRCAGFEREHDAMSAPSLHRATLDNQLLVSTVRRLDPEFPPLPACVLAVEPERCHIAANLDDSAADGVEVLHGGWRKCVAPTIPCNTAPSSPYAPATPPSQRDAPTVAVFRSRSARPRPASPDRRADRRAPWCAPTRGSPFAARSPACRRCAGIL